MEEGGTTQVAKSANSVHNRHPIMGVSNKVSSFVGKYIVTFMFCFIYICQQSVFGDKVLRLRIGSGQSVCDTIVAFPIMTATSMSEPGFPICS